MGFAQLILFLISLYLGFTQVDATSWFCKDFYTDPACTTPGETGDPYFFNVIDPYMFDGEHHESVSSSFFMVTKIWATQCVSSSSCVWSGLFRAPCNEYELNRDGKTACKEHDRRAKYGEENCKDLGCMDVPVTRKTPDNFCDSVWLKYTCDMFDNNVVSEVSYFDTKCKKPEQDCADDDVECRHRRSKSVNTTTCLVSSVDTAYSARYFKYRCSDEDDTSMVEERYNYGPAITVGICVVIIALCGLGCCHSYKCCCFKKQAVDARGLISSGTELPRTLQ